MSIQTDNSDSEAIDNSAGTNHKSNTTTHSLKICTVCQQPIDSEAKRQWRGEPIHHRCINGL